MVILGIDPGTATTGFGVVQKTGQTLLALDYGVILTSPKETPPERLNRVYAEINRLFDLHQPDVLVTERLFFAKNETTAFGVGRTIGVILLTAAQRRIPWTEYTPPEVKLSVVGHGNADKKQVQYMIQRILKLKETPKPDDAADALAVAVCHAHTNRPLEYPGE
ncbi:MAG: crossover junction endodeoxyribonuclease RuvC [Chthonomonadales bacterium]